MKSNNITWTIIGATATVAAMVITYKRKSSIALIRKLGNSAKKLSSKLVDLSVQIKDKLLYQSKGPHGEPVFIDMYNRAFYETIEGKRIYLETH